MTPGLVVLHGNRLESLRDAVLEWLARHPLPPLDDEIILVQSNGAAEWLKMSLARAHGICAATRVELPARFLWRSYRQVLGAAVVPAQSALDASALVWRLMRWLPQRVHEPVFEPVFAPIARFLHDDDLGRRLQLATRLADLFDQYQVYRADVLAAWADGHDVWIDAKGEARPLPPDDRWQAALWRDLLGELTVEQRRATRAEVHREFIAALEDPQAAPVAALPRRVTVFGVSHLPGQTLAALAALARHCQVLLAVPNPCRFHWADIIEGRELLARARPRHGARGSTDLAAISLDAMHGHAHPLLAAWGRQGRDFMRQLDRFDESAAMSHVLDIPRIDLFDDGPGETLLQQVQAGIRDLLPLAEHPARTVALRDRSIVFQVAHSPQREVEILHDQLLRLFAEPPGGEPLRPREVVVMVPDIETFAPAIRAVFGQYGRDDSRHIPFDIADLRSRSADPLLIAVDWLLRLPAQRIGVTEVRSLLEVPAIAARFGLEAADLPTVARWLDGAGVRWGLDEAQRTSLGLQACGEQNSWLFGLRRMLLGYASGADAAFDGIEPYAEIGGLEAGLVGSLAELTDALGAWWQASLPHAPPVVWAVRCRNLLDAFIAPTDERVRLSVAALGTALTAWLDACDLAGFDEPVSLDVLREAWLGGVDAAGGGGRFLAGGVTFCTLMPLRSVPFEVVCLLGMNDGDYPRGTRPSDFDLMARPGQQRPGDRSRRHDDRYLMLEALLSARRVLSVSWCGRSVRDNTEQPPSVLVSQLRDYLAAGWQGDAAKLLDQLTTAHPLQPFSPRYFTGGPLFTYAAEWRAAHSASAAATGDSLPTFEPSGVALTLQLLSRFLKNPVAEFFRVRLDVSFRDEDDAVDDDESFGPDALQRHQLLSGLADPAANASIDIATDRLRRSGELPIGEGGQRMAGELGREAATMRAAWQALHDRYPHDVPKEPLRFEHGGLRIDDWLDGLRGDGEHRVVITLTASQLTEGRKAQPRPHQMIEAWVRTLVSSALGVPVTSLLIGRDAVVTASPIDAAEAREALGDLLQAWRDGMQAPLPLPFMTGHAEVEGGKPALTYEGDRRFVRGEVDEPCLARVFPDFESLTTDGRFEPLARGLLGPMKRWLDKRVKGAPHAGPPPATTGDDD